MTAIVFNPSTRSQINFSPSATLWRLVSTDRLEGLHEVK
uniref:Uncharacterized protein n=1 Tax=Anguilla anguilla TaxID=7936 RepID=A0A0E9WA57_ANGAN